MYMINYFAGCFNMFQHVSITNQMPNACLRCLGLAIGLLMTAAVRPWPSRDQLICGPLTPLLTWNLGQNERPATDEDLWADLEVQPHKHWRCIPAVLYGCGVASDRWGLQPSVVATYDVWVSRKLSSLGIELVPFPFFSIFFPVWNVTIYVLWT